MKRIAQAFVISTAVLLSACSTAQQNTPTPAACGAAPRVDFQQNALIRANYLAADALCKSANQRREMQKQVPILVATLVNIDSLTESSRFGRIVSEQIQARLS